MKENKSVRKDGKMIHVRLDEKLHKKLKIKVAKNDMTIQEWVSELIITSIDKSIGKRK